MSVASKVRSPRVTATTQIVEIDASYKAMLDELSEVSLARSEAEKREKEIKAEIGLLLPARSKGVNIVVRCAGAIRLKVTLSSRDGNSAAILKESFPEAYEASKTTSYFDRFLPA